MPEEENLLLVRDLCSRIKNNDNNRKFDFEDINFRLAKKEILVVVGENGSGKSSLAKSIIGLNKVSSGSVYLNGEIVAGNVMDFYTNNMAMAKRLKNTEKLVQLSRRVAFEFLYASKYQYFKYVKNLKYNKKTGLIDGEFSKVYNDIPFETDDVINVVGTSAWKYIGIYRRTQIQIMEAVSEAVLMLIRQEHLLDRNVITFGDDEKLIYRQKRYHEKTSELIKILKTIKKSIRFVYNTTIEIARRRQKICEEFNSIEEYYLYVFDCIDRVVSAHNDVIEIAKSVADFARQITAMSAPLNKRGHFIDYYNKKINIPRSVIKKDYVDYYKKLVEWKVKADPRFKKDDLDFIGLEIKNLWSKGLIDFQTMKKYLKTLRKKLEGNFKGDDEIFDQLIEKLNDNHFEVEFINFHENVVKKDQVTLEDIDKWEVKIKYVLKVIKKNIVDNRILVDKWHEFKNISYGFYRDKIAEYEEIIEFLEESDIDKIVSKYRVSRGVNKNHVNTYKREIQYIHRNPITVLNEKITIEQIMLETLQAFPELYKDINVRQEYLDWYNKDDSTKFYTSLTLDDVRDSEVKRYLVIKALRSVGLASSFMFSYPSELSTSQVARIALARALIVKPKVLIIDEPSTDLDATFCIIYFNLVKKFREEGLSVIIIEKDIKIARQYADRIAIMVDGRIVEISTTDEILNTPLHSYTRKIVAAIPRLRFAFRKAGIEPYESLSKVEYIIDIPIVFEVFPNHFVKLRDREYAEIMREYEKEIAAKWKAAK